MNDIHKMNYILVNSHCIMRLVEVIIPTVLLKLNKIIMTNYLSIASATAVSYFWGSIWYLLLGKPWRKALGWKDNTDSPYRPTPFELVFAFIGQLLIAIFLYWLFQKLQVTTVMETISYVCIVWFGVILSTLSTNVIFQRRNLVLILIDGGHWLMILLTIGLMLYFTK